MTVRAIGYVRVSTAREDMISPELQVSAIRDHCTRHGYTLVDVHADLDQSGRNFARVEVQRVIERVEAGEASVVVVWKVSRFGRTRRDWYVHADRLEVVGGRLESATEGFDAATSVGKFTRGMLVELAAFESDRIGDVWREVQQRRIREGLTHNGRARFGYVYDRHAGVHVPDPVTGPILAECYRAFVAGSSPYALARDLNSRGIRTTSGGLWTDGTLRRVLASGFGAGFVPYLGALCPGAHEPVIEPATWAAYQSARGERARTPPQRLASPYLLSGLIRCAACGSAMTGGTFGKGRHPKYRCERRRSTAGVGCTGGYVAAEHVHAAVLAWLEQVAGDVDAAAAASRDAEQARDVRAGEADRIAGEVARLEGALVRLAQAHAEDEHADEQVFRAARDDYRRRLDDLRAQHDAATRTVARLAAPVAAVARPLLDDWATIGVEGRREVLRRLLARVEVRTHGRGTPADVAVVPLWSDVA